MLLRHLTNKSKQTLGTCCKTFEMIHSTKASTNWIRKRTYFQHEFKYLSSVRYWDKSWIVDYYMGLKPDRRTIECISSVLYGHIYSDKRRMGLNSSFGIYSTKFAMKNQPMFWTDIPIQNTTKPSLNVHFDILYVFLRGFKGLVCKNNSGPITDLMRPRPFVCLVIRSQILTYAHRLV